MLGRFWVTSDAVLVFPGNLSGDWGDKVLISGYNV